MGIRSFILGVVLLGAVGLCMVQESTLQTQARYKLAELSKREAELRKNIDKLKAREEQLRNPFRLAELVREKKMRLIALRQEMPESATGYDRVATVSLRQPGQIEDPAFLNRELGMDVAVSDW